jgi:hypothetical protein
VTRQFLTSLTAGLALAFAAPVMADEAVAPDAEAVRAASTAADAEDAASRDQFRQLDQDVQSLKKEVLDLNRDLLDVGEYFKLDSVSLKIDGKEVANYLYTDREAGSLLRGGVHRVHMANLKAGDHELVAIFTGQGPQSREYRRGATLNFSKGIGAKYVELEITDRVKKQQPEFVIKEWE